LVAPVIRLLRSFPIWRTLQQSLVPKDGPRIPGVFPWKATCGLLMTGQLSDCIPFLGLF